MNVFNNSVILASIDLYTLVGLCLRGTVCQSKLRICTPKGVSLFPTQKESPFFYPVAQLLMLKPLGVQATSERVVVAVYVVDVDVVVIQ